MTFMTFLAYITLGLFIGWLSRVITQDRGVEMIPSLFFGVLGAVSGMLIVQFLGLAGGAFYAVVGAMGILFTVNVFRQDDPVFMETKTSGS
ncbi:hypothetical protein [Gracilimonas mengyeensis]|uniref:Transglycosylase associated protein n=1 Tax=Gracilimonas mengyeensis TaxID=1302730 RepID=A0A521EM48_9BACT|nr:hypothetical protein [Gracilimonas mengyeensis]SMO84997.1 hypothetical protein SAMN06265219_112152 [Gracilimonas mengyeensis]